MLASSRHPRPIEQRLCQRRTGLGFNENGALQGDRATLGATMTRDADRLSQPLPLGDNYFASDENLLGQRLAMPPPNGVMPIADVEDSKRISIRQRILI